MGIASPLARSGPAGHALFNQLAGRRLRPRACRCSRERTVGWRVGDAGHSMRRPRPQGLATYVLARMLPNVTGGSVYRADSWRGLVTGSNVWPLDMMVIPASDWIECTSRRLGSPSAALGIRCAARRAGRPDRGRWWSSREIYVLEMSHREFFHSVALYFHAIAAWLTQTSGTNATLRTPCISFGWVVFGTVCISYARLSGGPGRSLACLRGCWSGPFWLRLGYQIFA